MHVKNILHLFFAFALPCLGADQPVAAATATPVPEVIAPIEAKDVEVTLVPDSATIMVGEPIYVSLVVKNISGHDLGIYMQDDATPGEGMASGIKLTAVDKAGAEVPAAPLPPEARRATMGFGRMRGDYPQQLPDGKSKTLQLWLPWRFVLQKPGSYTLTATAPLRFTGKMDNSTLGRPGGGDLTVTATASLEVIPVDKEKMGQLIDALEKQVTATSRTIYDNQIPPGYNESFAAWRKLYGIDDERVVPFFRRQLRGDYWDGNWPGALGALAKFNNDDALDSLKDALEVTELINPASHKPDTQAVTQLHIAACDDLMRSPHPGAITYLVTQQKNPDLQVRIKVMQAVAEKLPAKEAIPILEKMQDDPQKWVGEYATRYLNTLKAGKPVKVEKEPFISGDL